MLLAAAIGTLLLFEVLARSPLCRTFRAMRVNEVAASSMGKDVARIKLEVLVLGSMISGLAGALYAFYTCYVGPAVYGRLEWTFLPWLMVIFGGWGTTLALL